jgi:hypothetical protein
MNVAARHDAPAPARRLSSPIDNHAKRKKAKKTNLELRKSGTNSKTEFENQPNVSFFS